MNEELITADMLLPDVVARFPATRAVLDQYGLKGCGGPTGPGQSVARFARLYGMSLDRLLGELNEVASRPQPEWASANPSIADTIYRPFFLAGIITVLSVGSLWGAVNLLLIGLRYDFAAVDYSWLLAHGHAMIFGFVGFFIIGFSYQSFPGFKHATLWRPGLAFSVLPLMAVGIILQTLGHLLAPKSPFLLLGVAAALLQLAGVIIFTLVITRTNQLARRPEPYDRFIYSALVWFLLAALGNPFVFWLFETARDMNQFLFRVATYNMPYRDVQLLGIAVVMILGVSLRYLPHAYALREPSNKWRAFLLWGTNGSITVGIMAFLAARLSGNYWLMGVQEGAALVLLIVAVGTLWQYRWFSQGPESERDRGLKFIRAAHVWFIVAMAMLVLVPVYNSGVYKPFTGAGYSFSHAFFGAYRHALAIGFITMMIVGVSSRVVPTLFGVNLRRSNSLWPTFFLLNIGNATRIVAEIATDFTPVAYPLMGMTGFIEVFALSLWGFELIKNMRAGVCLERQSIQGLIKRG